MGFFSSFETEFTLALCGIGIIFNALEMVVFLSPSLRKRQSSLLLVAISVCNLLMVVCTGLLYLTFKYIWSISSKILGMPVGHLIINTIIALELGASHLQILLLMLLSYQRADRVRQSVRFSRRSLSAITANLSTGYNRLAVVALVFVSFCVYIQPGVVHFLYSEGVLGPSNSSSSDMCFHILVHKLFTFYDIIVLSIAPAIFMTLWFWRLALQLWKHRNSHVMLTTDASWRPAKLMLGLWVIYVITGAVPILVIRGQIAFCPSKRVGFGPIGDHANCSYVNCQLVKDDLFSCMNVLWTVQYASFDTLLYYKYIGKFRDQAKRFVCFCRSTGNTEISQPPSGRPIRRTLTRA